MTGPKARIPSVDEVLRRPDVAALAAPRWALAAAVRAELARVREAALAAHAAPVEVDVGRLAADVKDRMRAGLRPVINATGVVLHTNLGRAPLAAAALARVSEVAAGYSNLEYDLAAGGRGARERHAALAAELAGAEACVVVNNCAAAVLLALAACGSGREVVVSRGELIEIGGGFRIPEVMAASGARLVEVGTTNKTRPDDFAAAVRAETALLMKVHRSNFAIIGFTADVSVRELVELGRARGVPVLVDLGSGALVAGLGEPTVAEVVEAGADLVCFSGDKLMGGPQAGLIVGKHELVARCAAHPLYRAVRPDKLALAALEATLELYRDGREAEVPAQAMLATPAAVVRARAEALAAAATGVPLEVIGVASKVGGGTLPLTELPSWAVALVGPWVGGVAAERAAARLRAGEPPVVGRIMDDRLVLDLRTVADADVAALARALIALA